MTLYEINDAMQLFFDRGFDEECVDMETGEIVPELVAARMEALKLDLDEKIKNIALYIKNLDARASAIAAEEQALKARKSAAERRSKRLRQYLLDFMRENEIARREYAECDVRTSAGRESVDVYDKHAFLDFATNEGREDLLTYKIPDPAKSAIGDAIRAGEEIPGVRIVRTPSLTIK